MFMHIGSVMLNPQNSKRDENDNDYQDSNQAPITAWLSV